MVLAHLVIEEYQVELATWDQREKKDQLDLKDHQGLLEIKAFLDHLVQKVSLVMLARKVLLDLLVNLVKLDQLERKEVMVFLELQGLKASKGKRELKVFRELQDPQERMVLM